MLSVFSKASSSSAFPLVLPKLQMILRSQLQDVVMNKNVQGECVCQIQAQLCQTTAAAAWLPTLQLDVNVTESLGL